MTMPGARRGASSLVLSLDLVGAPHAEPGRATDLIGLELARRMGWGASEADAAPPVDFLAQPAPMPVVHGR